jgi:aryl-alcohol dehydrogenase-like predicted oxidoreductase
MALPESSLAPTLPRPCLSSVLPPLILGTATFNTQYVADPTSMPYSSIISRALEQGINAFDTSPYYGPSETLLGAAISAIQPPPDRSSYLLITKAGRIAPAEFDYSPAWIRYSVCRSLERLRTPYLDLVYTHDVEFVSASEVVTAVRELRKLRDEGLVRFVGISGYPVPILCSLAETILRETGEPLDAVLSYSNFCVQSSVLGQEEVLGRMRAARVGVVLNASMLSMGLLTTRGADRGPMAVWHPAPLELQVACRNLATIAGEASQSLEAVAIRWALYNWGQIGAEFGSELGAEFSRSVGSGSDSGDGKGSRVGASVMGVSSVEELNQTCVVWQSVLADISTSRAVEEHHHHRQRHFRLQDGDKTQSQLVQAIVDRMRAALGSWSDYSWASPGTDFVNKRARPGQTPDDEIMVKYASLIRPE